MPGFWIESEEVVRAVRVKYILMTCFSEGYDGEPGISGKTID